MYIYSISTTTTDINGNTVVVFHFLLPSSFLDWICQERTRYSLGILKHNGRMQTHPHPWKQNAMSGRGHDFNKP
jgi:hypothetical protein